MAERVKAAAQGTRVVTSADPGAEVLSSPEGTVSVAVVYPPVTPGPEPYAASQPALDRLVEQARADGVDGVDVELTG